MIPPEAIARAYVACVEIGDRTSDSTPEHAQELQELRAEIHALMMQVFRESGISFVDRADAARIAFELARAPALQES